MLLNGNIGLIKLDHNGATITVALNSYINGVYNITITAPAQYSIFDLTLPVGSYFNQLSERNDYNGIKNELYKVNKQGHVKDSRL